ncbi:response regulator transcription factor [Stenotrophomonas sp. PS02298]|uniref:response regulator n=1 Tax=Stenotrophomonas sp. PS02298 TaxID=2991424 RepID=UPI000DB27F79|nr:response regulator transcription factor [Stenotrophomonas sp. PS02298]PZU25290.1 MAG: DNA-binding response regulator [Stenotrophomonas sp.]
MTDIQTLHRLLVVDDDSDIRSLLAEQLGRAGYAVSTAADGNQMRQVLAREHIDLIVLDLNLPREDGLALCRELRVRSTTPVIMLTARSEPIDRVLGLEMGADDYLAKPFEPRELLARIRNVLRRTEALPTNMEPLAMRRALFSGWVFDLEHRHLVDPAKRVVMLSGAEFRLLRVLVAHANKVLSREQLVSLSSGRNYESQDRAIDLQISRLRQKLADAGGADGLIKTVRNEGYVFASAVTLE